MGENKQTTALLDGFIGGEIILTLTTTQVYEAEAGIFEAPMQVEGTLLDSDYEWLLLAVGPEGTPTLVALKEVVKLEERSEPHEAMLGAPKKEEMS